MRRTHAVIDAHHHWIPEDHLARLEEFLREGESVRRRGETISLMRGAEAVNNFNERVGDISVHLADMDVAGVDRAIFSLGIWLEWMSLPAARAVNDTMARIQEQSGQRIVGLVHVPPLEDGAAREVERGVCELGLRGVNLTTHWLGTYVDEPAFRPLLRKVAELDVPVLVHASSASGRCAALDGDGTQLGRVVDQTVLVIRLMLSSLFEELPSLRVVLPQLGGSFFGIMSRLGLSDPAADRIDDGWGRTLLATRTAALENLWFDTGPGGQWGGHELRLALTNLGPERLLFGTDYPSRRHWLKQGVDTWRSIDMPDRDRGLVMGGNAATVFKL